MLVAYRQPMRSGQFRQPPARWGCGSLSVQYKNVLYMNNILKIMFNYYAPKALGYKEWHYQ